MGHFGLDPVLWSVAKIPARSILIHAGSSPKPCTKLPLRLPTWHLPGTCIGCSTVYQGRETPLSRRSVFSYISHWDVPETCSAYSERLGRSKGKISNFSQKL